MGFFLLVAGVGMGGGGSGVVAATGRITVVAYQFGNDWLAAYQWGVK